MVAVSKPSYVSGYSIGVGGVVLCGEKCLLVHSAYGAKEWAIPGGYVERDETIDRAIQREILEEAGVQAGVQGLIAARNRVSSKDNSAYFIFLLHAADETAQADQAEVTHARYFSLAEINTMSDVNALTRTVVTRVLEGHAKVLSFQSHPTIPASEYVLYI